MANPIVLPYDIVLAITTIKASGIDPNDFNNAVQDLFNRGYGVQGKWIQDHKNLYLQALQDGFIAEGAEVPVSENVVPPTPSNPKGYETGGIYPLPAKDTEDGAGDLVPPAAEPPVYASEVSQETSTEDNSFDDVTEPAEAPEGKHRGHK